MKPPISLSLAIAAIMILAAYNCATLGRVPAYPSDDDGGYSAAAYQFWQTGMPGVPGYKDVVDLGREVWAFGHTSAAIQGVFLNGFGVSLFAALLPTFLAGLALLAVTAMIGNLLWDLNTGVLASLLLAASGKFFEACHGARPDMLLALFFLLSLWLVASAPANRPYHKLFLAGMLMGLSGDVHLNGFLLAPVPLLFWFFLRPENFHVRWRTAATYTSAVFIGVFAWLATHYFPHPQEMLHQAALYGGMTHGIRIQSLGLWGSLKQELGRYLDWFWAARAHRHVYEGLCVLVGGIWMLRRESRIGIALVAAWLSVFLIAAAFMSNSFGWYLIYVWPIFALWCARMFCAFPVRSAAKAALLVLIAAYFSNIGVWQFQAMREAPLQSKLGELRHMLPPEAPVLGNGIFWFAFWDRDFTDEMYVKFRRLETKLDPVSGPTSWQGEQAKKTWRYIVASGEFRQFLDPEIPLAELLSSAAFAGRASEIREDRAFSVERCSVFKRIPGLADSILILRIKESDKGVAE